MTAGTITPLHFYRKGEAGEGGQGRGQQVLAKQINLCMFEHHLISST